MSEENGVLLLREELVQWVLFGEFCLYKLPTYASIMRKSWFCVSGATASYMTRAESFDTPLAYIACSIGHSNISLIVIKCSKSNTNAIGDTDCSVIHQNYCGNAFIFQAKYSSSFPTTYYLSSYVVGKDYFKQSSDTQLIFSNNMSLFRLNRTCVASDMPTAWKDQRLFQAQ